MMTPNILTIRTQTYANAIYIFGTNRLTTRDGFPGVATGYYTPVETYASVNFTQYDIDNALSNGWLTQQEHDETIALIV